MKAGKTNRFFFAFKYARAKSCEVLVYLPWLKLLAVSNPSWGLAHAGDL